MIMKSHKCINNMFSTVSLDGELTVNPMVEKIDHDDFTVVPLKKNNNACEYLKV